MKRFLTILLLLVTVVAVTGCEPTKPKSTAQSIEEIKAKLEEIQDYIDKTESLLIKRTAQRDTAKSELNQLVHRADKTPKEIKAELAIEKSELDSQIWFQEIRGAWGKLKMLERYVIIFTRQENRLKTSKLKLEQSLEKIKLIQENEDVFIPGADPELDRLIAEGEVIGQDSDWDKLTSGEQAEIDIKVDKLMDETIENNVSKIPGLELKSIEELPALPDITLKVQTPDAPAQKSLFGRVKNDCNKIVEKVQKEADEYLKEKQPEAACSCWLEAIKRIVDKVNSASDQFTTGTFTDYLNALETCQKDTLRILCKPYLQTFAQCVKDLESKDPDWDAIAESLEGLLRIRPTLIKSDVETLSEKVEIVRSHLTYLLKENDRNAKVKSQRIETVLERVDTVYIKVCRSGAQQAPGKAEDEAPKRDLPRAGAKAGERKTVTVNGVEFAFRWCPPGTFTMGSPNSEDDRSDDEEQHQVMLTNGFWMLETEVTQKQWKAVMGNNPSNFKGDDLPVEKVSWNDCQEFCKKCAQLGFPVQLPTEAQWEYACRAGSTTAYFWGNALNGDKANCDGNYPCGTTTKGPYLVKTTPVGSYQPNAWGLYDMHGNVWEWCQDWYAKAYPSGSVTDPTGPSSGSNRVSRGGCWDSSARYCRSASRDYSGPGNRDDHLGFRLVKGQ